MISKVQATVIVILAILVVTTARAQPLPSPESDSVRQEEAKVLIGTTLGMLFHELGHALIHELDVPAVGHEEDVVDNFAILYLSTFGSQSSRDPFWNSIVRYSSLMSLHNSASPVQDELGNALIPQPRWFGEHAPDMRRFNNAVCLIYGSDPEAYGDLVERYDFDSAYRQKCIREHYRQIRAFDTILRPFLRNDSVDAEEPQAGARILPTFRPSGIEAGRYLVEILNEFLTNALRSWEERILWPRDLTVTFRDCDDYASYSPTANEITICYGGILTLAWNTLQGEDIGTYFVGSSCLFQEGVDYLKNSTWSAWAPFPPQLSEMSFFANGRVLLKFRLMNENEQIEEGINTDFTWWVERARSTVYAVHLQPDSISLQENSAPLPASVRLYTVRDANTMESEDGRVWRRIENVENAILEEQLRGSLPTRPCGS